MVSKAAEFLRLIERIVDKEIQLVSTGCSFAFDIFKIVIKSSISSKICVMGHLKAKTWGFAI